MANLGTVFLNGTAIGIAAGGGHTCALLDGGYVKCWGFNGNLRPVKVCESQFLKNGSENTYF